MSGIKKNHLLIGAHTSTAKGLYHALLEGKEIGATTVQLFTRNQRRWENKPLTGEEIDIWHTTREETGIEVIMSHASYLINLGAPDPEILQKSRKAFEEEVERCSLLDISFLTVHPGAALKESRLVCLDRIVESIISAETALNKSSTRILLETTAGQGSVIGSQFEELAYIVEKVCEYVPVGICFDTCHSFAAGYDIRTAEAWETTLAAFDDSIGIKHLSAFHLNDSMKGLGSHRDRHAQLGNGEIGIESFKALMKNEKMRALPKYLETPGGDPIWKKEIAMLRRFATL